VTPALSEPLVARGVAPAPLHLGRTPPSPLPSAEMGRRLAGTVPGFSKGAGGGRCCPAESWSSTYTADFTPLPSGSGRVSSSSFLAGARDIEKAANEFVVGLGASRKQRTNSSLVLVALFSSVVMQTVGQRPCNDGQGSVLDEENGGYNHTHCTRIVLSLLSSEMGFVSQVPPLHQVCIQVLSCFTVFLIHSSAAPSLCVTLGSTAVARPFATAVCTTQRPSRKARGLLHCGANTRTWVQT
jgi:hypothetical protein